MLIDFFNGRCFALATILNYEQLKNYLFIVMDMEKNVYIQKETINDLSDFADSLGYRKQFNNVQKTHNNASFGSIFSVLSVICCIISIIVTFIVLLQFKSENMLAGFLDVVAYVVYALLIGIPIGLVIAVVISLIIYAISSSIKSSQINAQYRQDLHEQQIAINRDNQRVQNELMQREYIIKQINELKSKLQASENTLNYFYSFDVIDRQYRHDLSAICSFYQYLRAGKTYSLSRNIETGDPGAYNIYDNEYRQGLIISKLDIVITKLDEIAKNQRELAWAIQDANKKISTLNQTVIHSSSQIQYSIRKSSAVNTYNQERIRKEIEYGNTMQMYFHLR